MNKLKHLILFLLAISHLLVYGQNCIDYGVFDDPYCLNCAPTGWSTVTWGPDIIYPGFSCSGQGASPTGGNYVSLMSNSSPHDEAIETTINGLNVGEFYYMAFWYFSEVCDNTPICCSPLIVIVDGIIHEFPETGDEWELAELCVEAIAETMHIQLESALGDDTQSWLYIDDAECQGNGDCCSVFVELQDEDEVCPNQPLQFEGEITNNIGDVEIIWDADPSGALAYLSDLTIIDPVFLFPSTDPQFEGLTFDFQVTVIDGNCEALTEIEVTVLPHIQVQFEFEDIYCQTYGEIDLLNISDDGYTGVWQIPVINTNNFPGQMISNVFIPDPGQAGCPAETAYEFLIEPYEYPVFDFPLIWCRFLFTSFEFPEVSTNGVEGDWDLPELFPEDHNDGLIELIFTPDDLFCSDIAIVEIVLTSGDLLSFDLPDMYCTEEGLIDIPDESLNGVEGIWSVNPLDVSQLSGPQTVTFTPMDENCYQPYDYAFDVATFGPITFDTISPICRNSGVIILDSTSLEGYEGTWSQSTFDVDTIMASSFTSTWTSLPGQVSCMIDTTLTFDIVEPAEPAFDLPSTICVSENVFTFPDISLDSSVTGTWSVSSVDPSMTGMSTIQSIFTPEDSLCALPFVWELEVTDEIEPIFSFPLLLCENDPILELNNISEDGVEGQWTINQIDPSQWAGQTVETTFMPIQNSACISSLTINIEVESNLTPQFVLPAYLCWTDDDLILNNVSDNGIPGSWNNNVLVISDNLGETVSLSFTPDQTFCTSSFNTEVEIIDIFNTSISTTNPASCQEANGKIEVQGEITDLEFSIDEGINWQSDPCFENLSGGAFTIYIRSTSYSDCMLEENIQLEAPGAPEILSVDVEDITGCNNRDGMIIINAQGNDLEYSIDGGTTWQSINTFSNLDTGNYTFVVRESGIDDCVAERMVDIEGFPLTVLLSVERTDLSDCLSNDGEIVVLAQGQNLEYSIDNGVSWVDTNLFENLSEGVYDIIVRSKDDPDCLENATAELLAPVTPSIQDLITSHPGNCNPTTGTIEINASGNNLEYSIDNGLSWQVDNLFTDLAQGNYDIIVREIDQANCIDSDNTVLIEEPESLSDVTLETIGPTSCTSNDAQIIISSDDPDIAISYDQGITWQTNLVISNLEPGNYTILIQHTVFENCRTSFDVDIDNADCPCDDLIIDYNVTPMYCIDEANGSIEITNVIGHMDDYEIIWDNGTQGASLNNLSGGWYPFTVLYDEDCTWRDSVFVDQIDPLNFSLTTFDSNCPGAPDGSIEITEISGGNGNYTYSLDGIEYQTSNVFVDLAPSEYQVFVLDEQNCLQSQLVELLSDDPIEVDFPQILPIQQGETVHLNPLIDEMSIDSFEWEPHPSILNPGHLIAEVSPQQTTSYTLSIFYGLCIEVRIITVEVIESKDIYIANIISINSQNGNNKFYIQSDDDTNITVNNLSIFDRWGNLVFTKDNLEINNPDEGWNGYYNNYKVQNGVYVYMLEYSLAGETKIEAGTITVVY